MRFYFYILYSETKDKYYVGHTGDNLEEQINNHNSSQKESTSVNGDWRLVHTQLFLNKSTAYLREQEVKNWKSRKKIELLIKKAGSEHPD